jgi:hypothetical protein
MDPDAIVNGDHFIFDAEILREVYEIAKQVKDLRNYAFFLRQLKICALLDGEERNLSKGGKFRTWEVEESTVARLIHVRESAGNIVVFE